MELGRNGVVVICDYGRRVSKEIELELVYKHSQKSTQLVRKLEPSSSLRNGKEMFLKMTDGKKTY